MVCENEAGTKGREEKSKRERDCGITIPACTLPALALRLISSKVNGVYLWREHAILQCALLSPLFSRIKNERSVILCGLCCRLCWSLFSSVQFRCELVSQYSAGVCWFLCVVQVFAGLTVHTVQVCAGLSLLLQVCAGLFCAVQYRCERVCPYYCRCELVSLCSTGVSLSVPTTTVQVFAGLTVQFRCVLVSQYSSGVSWSLRTVQVCAGLFCAVQVCAGLSVLYRCERVWPYYCRCVLVSLCSTGVSWFLCAVQVFAGLTVQFRCLLVSQYSSGVSWSLSTVQVFAGLTVHTVQVCAGLSLLLQVCAGLFCAVQVCAGLFCAVQVCASLSVQYRCVLVSLCSTGVSLSVPTTAVQFRCELVSVQYRCVLYRCVLVSQYSSGVSWSLSTVQVCAGLFCAVQVCASLSVQYRCVLVSLCSTGVSLSVPTTAVQFRCELVSVQYRCVLVSLCSTGYRCVLVSQYSSGVSWSLCTVQYRCELVSLHNTVQVCAGLSVQYRCELASLYSTARSVHTDREFRPRWAELRRDANEEAELQGDVGGCRSRGDSRTTTRTCCTAAEIQSTANRASERGTAKKSKRGGETTI
ncbi:hypothetical protein JZ751_004551 [Albula glossodonta]|uniref:Uncharacterized protein n=1 Tax=Albula glossodonta TaxID=121402 RepID=A0A8T2N6A4_9TELE|nr:hypothetical protein JZ751_004551 [Albula glossodonta]